MSIYQLKTQFQNLLRPISNNLVKQGVTANQVTVSAIVLSGATAYVVAYPAQDNQRLYYVLPVSLFIRMTMNAIDGMIAKEHNQASQLGAVLNEVGDLLSDSMLIASLSNLSNISTLSSPPKLSTSHSLQPVNSVDSCANAESFNKHHHLLLSLSLGTEFVAILGSQFIAQRANQGPLGKSDRAFELGLIGLLCGMGRSSWLSPSYPSYQRHLYMLYLFNELLLLKTIGNRIAFIAKTAWQDKYQQEIQQLTHFRQHSQQNLQYDFSQHNSSQQQNKDINVATDLNTNNADNTNNKQSKTNANLHKIAKESIQEHISSYNAYDGTAMFYRYWLSKPLEEIKANANNNTNTSTNNKEKIVIMLHRGHEHSARLEEMAIAYVQAGYQVFAWDARGNGRSGGERDDAESFSQLVRDLDHFVNLVTELINIHTEQMLIIASSLGAVIASSWVHDYAPNVRGMILGTPAFAIRLYVPFALPALKVAKKIGVVNRVSSYVKAKVLTHDSQAQQLYNDDPLISSGISRDLLIDSLETGKRLVDDAGAFTTPTFVLCAGQDYVVDKQVIRDFYEQIRSPIKRWQYYPNCYHAIFHELNKEQVFADCIEFTDEVFAKPLATVNLTQADKPTDFASSYSKDRVDRLEVKGLNPSFVATKFAMKKFGKISDGIATGLEHGFDSGRSLQKVYEHAPKGSHFIGKFIDNFYLNNIGWRGIRVRKQHLMELANLAIEQLNAELSAELKRQSAPNNANIHIMDIASGNGQYLFELCQQHDNLQAQLRDYDAHNVEIMQNKAKKLGLDNRVSSVQKDAFDSASYTQANKHSCDIAIASGVFELFSDNSQISTAIAGIYHELKAGGYFIYTNQPWHPEQEFIGKTLNSHQGKDWVMRCRSQAEMDQLVTSAGFKKVAMRIDEFGIFTVSLVKKD